MFHTQYSAYYDLFNSKKPYKKEVEFVYQWAGHPRSILDIGCGTANYWNFFPTTVRMRGLEKSKDMIDHSLNYKRITKADVNVINMSVLPEFECVTALFDVMNYLPKLDWMKELPLKKNKFFIFDVLDMDKALKDGFKTTKSEVNDVVRHIVPRKVIKSRGGRKEAIKSPYKQVLDISVKERDLSFTETHELYLWSKEAILKACGASFDLVDVKETESWQTWYRLRKK
jgi:SAM-dependent methyltransferase